VWEAHLSELPLERSLPEADREELRRHILVLLEEKEFEGCGGLEITDEIRVTIGAYAALLLLHRETDYYPQLASILVYPEAYSAPGERHVGEYLVEEGPEVREGESWYRGSMVLSWQDVRRGVGNPEGGENVVLHEFAHQLDDESGAADGTPVLGGRRLWRQWVRVCQIEFEALAEADDRGQRTLIDPYGAENPAEFFAVVTECFFLRPARLRDRHPELYALFAEYYRQDPAAWR
jgi:Mlc titration factor MtfA (ptsG expression regulator)